MASFTMFFKDVKKLYETRYNEVMNGYEIFDESYRETLNNRIFKTLKWYEIGYETPEMFFDRLEAWLDLNMQEYNFLYKSNLIKIEPLLRVQLLESFNGSKNASSTTNQNVDTTSKNTSNTTDIAHQEDTSNFTGNSTIKGTTENTVEETNNSTDSSTENKEVFNSDFPQGSLTSGEIGDANYFSSGSKGKDTNTSESENTRNSTTNGSSNSNESTTNSNESSTDKTSSSDTTTDFNSNVVGVNEYEGDSTENHTLEKTGLSDRTDSSMLMEYRQTFINIDKQLIEALKSELFMLIYNLN